MSFNDHLLNGRSLYDDNVKGFEINTSKTLTLDEKRAQMKELISAQLGAFTNLPLIRSFHLVDALVSGHDVEFHIAVVDDAGRSQLITPKYSFGAINVEEQILSDDMSFIDSLAVLALYQLIVPLSMCRTDPGNTFAQQLNKASVVSLSIKQGDAAGNALRMAITEMFGSAMAGESNLLNIIAFIAWNDRMNVMRVCQREEGTAKWVPEADPMHIIDLPVSYTYDGHPTEFMSELSSKRTLVSFSWGKESLLSANICERLAESTVYGIVKHNYKDTEGYSYQDDYDAFREGTRYENSKFLLSSNGYLRLIYSLVPLLPGVTHCMHHMYSMCHVINSWNDADLILLGDELERNFRNPLYRKADAIGGTFAQHQVFTYDRAVAHAAQNKGVFLMQPKSAFEAIIDDLGEVQFEPIAGAFDYTFDFHQSETLHRMMNSLFGQLGINKQVGSPVYNYPEIAIQFLLASLDPESFAYQASCWYAEKAKTENGSKWCNSCEKCHRLAWVMKSLDLDHDAFGLKYVDPLTYLTPKQITGNKVFAISSDRHAQGFAFGVCDAAVKFMLLRTVAEGDLKLAAERLPEELNFHAQSWVTDIEENLLALINDEDNASDVAKLGQDQTLLMAPHFDKLRSLINSHLNVWKAQLAN